MFRKIMVPVDLRNVAELEKALMVAADLATRHDADVVFVGVTGEQPNDLARSPADYAETLDAFAAEQAQARSVRASAKAVAAHDVTADLDAALRDALDDVGADLVVMASHAPGFANRFWPSHGGQMASRSGVSVFIVR